MVLISIYFEWSLRHFAALTQMLAPWAQVAAAWAQCIFTVVAVLFASRLSGRQERLSRATKAETCHGVLVYAQRVLTDCRNNATAYTTLAAVESLVSQFRSITLDSMPDPKLVTAMSSASSNLAVLEQALKSAKTPHPVMDNPDHREHAAESDIKTAIARLKEAEETAAAVARELKRSARF